MHVKTLPEKSYPWYVRLFFAKQKKTYGEVLDSGKVWGLSPLLFMGVALLFGAINRKSSPVMPAIRSLVTVRVSQINHCEFCVDLNSAVGMDRGVAPEKLAQLDQWRESDLFDEIERLVLEYVEAASITGNRVDDELVGRLKVHFDDQDLVELTGLIAFQNLSAKFNSALDIPAQGFCKTTR